MRSLVAEDGRWARFFLVFKSGQHAAFSLPFNTIGLYLKAVKNVIRTMADRLAARGAFSSAEIAEGHCHEVCGAHSSEYGYQTNREVLEVRKAGSDQ
jgi:hypothetical protein